jgi:hypothetical protein
VPKKSRVAVAKIVCLRMTWFCSGSLIRILREAIEWADQRAAVFSLKWGRRALTDESGRDSADKRRGAHSVLDAGFVDHGAEVAFGVAGAGVKAYLVLFGDQVQEFFDGAAFRGLFVHFELRGQAAQKFCCCHDERILSSGNERANRTCGLRNSLRNHYRISALCDVQIDASCHSRAAANLAPAWVRGTLTDIQRLA